MSKLHKAAIITGVIASLLCAAYFNKSKPLFFKTVEVYHPQTGLEGKIKSGNLITDYDIEKALSDIKKFGLNTVNVPIIVNVDSAQADDMNINIQSKAKAIDLIKRLNKEGINIILEPYPFIKNGEIPETLWKPTDNNLWFQNWKIKILQPLITDVANPNKIYAFNVASNLVNLEPSGEQWLSTIDDVRRSYKGLITYRTNWWSTAEWEPSTVKAYQEKLNNKLFSKVDFISVAAYFELTSSESNTVGNLVQALHSSQIYNRRQNIYQELKNFHKKWRKPVFLGEIGFPKRNKASCEPWNPRASEIVNTIEQANCFAAYRRVFENESWMMGFSVFHIGAKDESWEYYPSPESTIVIKEWYSKPNSQ